MAEQRFQRRLAAILAADVAEFSRLVGEDEEGTLAALSSHRTQLIDPKISEYGGRIANTAGDSILAEFPSVVEALRCSIEIQDGIAERNAAIPHRSRIAFRIGLNLGDVIEEDGDLFGEGVNVAARLENLADPGGICLSRAARDQVRDRMDVTLEDLGEVAVKNIERPVRVFRMVSKTDAKTSPRPLRKPHSRLRIAGAILAISIVAGGAVWWTQIWEGLISGGDPVSHMVRPTKPTLAVIPFENLSNDPDQDYFSEGLTEDIINALGRYRDLAVLAYNAAIPLRGSAKNSREITQSLGIRFLVEGTVRRSGDKVRIAARLTDAQNGAILWSERFDNENKDILAVQEEIAYRIAGTLASNLTRVEQRRIRSVSAPDPGAYDLVLRGRSDLRRATRRANRRARQSFERAITLEPDYAAAHAWMARAHYLVATDGWTEFPAQALERAESYAQRALNLDSRSVEAFRTLARIHAIQHQLERALSEIDQAIAIIPSDAEALGDRGLILLWSGKPKEAVAAFEPAFNFDPNLRGDYVFARGLSYYSLQRHEDAVRVLERGASRYPRYVFIRAALVAAYGQLGRTEEARRNAEAVRRLFPIFNAETFGMRFKNPELKSYLTEGLKKGGLIITPAGR